METDSKAVHFVLHVCEQAEQLAVGFHAYRYGGGAEQQFTGAVAAVLC